MGHFIWLKMSALKQAVIASRQLANLLLPRSGANFLFFPKISSIERL